MSEVNKSPNDTLLYKFITLQNHMNCILISDPDTETSAASMNVHVGSTLESIPGLAHYLEHMLFMGTQKYPEENSFSNFLSENAGESNAFTDHEDTNFYFKVSPDQLQEALSRFAQFFISPLFNEGSLSRELKSIDSEFHKNLQDDTWRSQQVLYGYFDQPLNHFSMGNSETLAVDGVRDKIIEFYSTFYSARLMSLVVCGSETIEELEEMVNENFLPIEDKEVMKSEFQGVKAVKEPGITKLVPVKDTKAIRFVWTVESCSKYYETKPDGYLGHLLGHEGKGSVLSVLKSAGLAEELFSFYNEDFSFCSFFTVEVKLTEKGLRSYEDVIEAVFSYIELLKQEQPQEYVFNELKQVAWAQFLFRNKKDPYGYCQKLCSRLTKYPYQQVITGPELYTKFDPEVIRKLTESLQFNNLQMFLVSQNYDKSQLDQERYFGTFFKYEKVSDELKAKIQNPRVFGLSLPVPNPYIPDTFEVLPASLVKYPEKIRQNSSLTLFYKQDNKYLVDKVYGQLVIHCNSFDFASNPYFFMMAKMWEKLLYEKLREETYLADIAGLKHDIEVDNHGLRLSLNGFSQKYSVFFGYLLREISTFRPTEADSRLFEDLKNELMNGISNCYFSKPTTQLQRIIFELDLHNGYFTQMEKLKALVSINLQDVIWYSGKWLKDVHFVWFLMGNISQSAAEGLAESLTSDFFTQKSALALKPSEFLPLRIAKIPKSRTELFTLPLTDPNNTNSAVVSQFQIGPETAQIECLADLVENYLEEPFFDELRTKQQIGYIVSSYSHKMRGIFHFMLMVQSSTHSPESIFSQISAFLQEHRENILNLTDKKFGKLVKTTLETSLKKNLSLHEEFQQFRHEIDSAAFCFDRKKKLKEELKKVKKEEFLQFYEQVFGNLARRLDICLVSQNMEATNTVQRPVKVFTGLKEFKRAHNSWRQVNKFS